MHEKKKKKKKELMAKYPNANISIQYPAKLICDKHVVKVMFPNWFRVIKGDRLGTNLGRVRSASLTQQDDEGESVFDSESGCLDIGGNNDIEMLDLLAAARGPVASPLFPPLSSEPTLSDGYVLWTNSNGLNELNVLIVLTT